jgi:hypothetical protein
MHVGWTGWRLPARASSTSWSCLSVYRTRCAAHHSDDTAALVLRRIVLAAELVWSQNIGVDARNSCPWVAP